MVGTQLGNGRMEQRHWCLERRRKEKENREWVGLCIRNAKWVRVSGKVREGEVSWIGGYFVVVISDMAAAAAQIVSKVETMEEKEVLTRLF